MSDTKIFRGRFVRNAAGVVLYLALVVGAEQVLTPKPVLWNPAAGLHFSFVLLFGWQAAPLVAVAEGLIGTPAWSAVLLAILHGAAARWVRPRLTRLNPAGPGVAVHFTLAALLLALASGFLESGEAVNQVFLRAGLHTAAGIAALTPLSLLLFWRLVHPWMRAAEPGEVFGLTMRGWARWRWGAQGLALAGALALVAALPAAHPARWLPVWPIVLWAAWADEFARSTLGVALVMAGALAMQALGADVAPLAFGSTYVALAVSAWLVGLLASERYRSLRLLREARERAGEMEADLLETPSTGNDSGEAGSSILAEPDTIEHWVQLLDAAQEKLAQRTRQLEASRRHLRAVQAQKDQLFANISHEFRTPLTLILGPLGSLRARLAAHLGDASRKQFAMIERNAQRLLRLVGQILDLARLEAGDLQLAAQPVRLGRQVRRITQPFQPLAEQQRLTLALSVEDDAVEDAAPCYVDPEKLEHILGNLLSNAVKFTPADGRITVSVRETEGEATIRVADTGVGIPPDQQERIFERFAQVDASATRAQEGSGIGLTLAHELVEAHGGTLGVESVPDEGTTFTVRLSRGKDHLRSDQIADTQTHDAPDAAEQLPSAHPQIKESSDAASESHASAQEPGMDQPQVLVVDDNADVRQYVRSVLAPSFAVRTAANGRAGLQAAREALPDVILADVMMPQMDGLEMTRRLKDDPATEAIPVVMLTARAEARDEVEGLTGGADDYVTKPFEPRVLEARVRGLLDLQRRLRRRLRDEAASDAPASDAPVFPADEPGERSEFEQEARAVVGEHLTDPDFEVEALASEMAMSRSTLYRRARENDAPSPADLIRAVRMERAAGLLRESEGTVTEVAYAVGYDSLSHFSEHFRDHAGTPPSTFA